MKYTTFILGFLLAAFLDLEPLATVTSALGKPATTSGGNTIGQAWILFSKVIEWSIVATSTLYGAPFWYSLLLKITGKPAPPSANARNTAAPASPTGGTAPPSGSPTGPTGPAASSPST